MASLNFIVQKIEEVSENLSRPLCLPAEGDRYDRPDLYCVEG